jgi:cytochrome c-type biogenesis protein CcmE
MKSRGRNRLILMIAIVTVVEIVIGLVKHNARLTIEMLALSGIAACFAWARSSSPQ